MITIGWGSIRSQMSFNAWYIANSSAKRTECMWSIFQVRDIPILGRYIAADVEGGDCMSDPSV